MHRDSDSFVAEVENRGAKAVIPPKKNRLNPREYDVEAYRERNIVERFFGEMKQCRRVATRYEKRARNYLGFVTLAAILIESWFAWGNRNRFIGNKS